jgi:hypothetical protein
MGIARAFLFLHFLQYPTVREMPKRRSTAAERLYPRCLRQKLRCDVSYRNCGSVKPCTMRYVFVIHSFVIFVRSFVSFVFRTILRFRIPHLRSRANQISSYRLPTFKFIFFSHIVDCLVKIDKCERLQK